MEEDRLTKLSKREQYVTDPFIDEIILHREKRFTSDGVMRTDYVRTNYPVYRNGVWNPFKCSVVPHVDYGVATPRVYDVLHAISDIWRRAGCPEYLEIGSVKKIQDIINYSHTDTIIENIKAVAHYSIFIDRVWDREGVIIHNTTNLAPFLECEIEKYKYKKEGYVIGVRFNPIYVEYAKRNLVYLDFRLQDIYKELPTKGESRRVIFIVAKKLCANKPYKFIDTRQGYQFSEVFKLPQYPKRREDRIKKIFDQIQNVGYISSYKYYPKDGKITFKKGRSPINDADVRREKEFREQEVPKQKLDTAEGNERYLKEMGFFDNAISGYAKKYRNRIPCCYQYFKKQDNNFKSRAGGWVRNVLDKCLVGEWDESFLGTFNPKYIMSVYEARGLVERINKQLSKGKSLAEAIVYNMYPMMKEQLPMHKKFYTYFYGIDAWDGVDDELRKQVKH